MGSNPEDFVQKIQQCYESEEIWNEYSWIGPIHARNWFGKTAGAVDLDDVLKRLFTLPPQSFAGESKQLNGIEYIVKRPQIKRPKKRAPGKH